ncbi:MAG: hypothetical protein J0G95_08185 [Rhizobiales bacterium]|jgi:hypothetical protein|nr:hypothetical protein [Hyphomicrobiales bacterium]
MLRLNAALSFLLILGWSLHQLSAWIGSLKPKHTADEIAAMVSDSGHPPGA